MRRKRKTRYTWLPVTGSNRGGGEGTYEYNARGIPSLQTPVVSGTPGPQQNVFAVIPDTTSNPGGDSSLADVVQGQDWILKRIVGKIHLQCTAQSTGTLRGTIWSQVLVSVGFFIARAQDQAQTTVDLDQIEVEPMSRLNTMNPWIWRRTWILSNPAYTRSAASLLPQWPNTTAGYGSMAEGSHIDSKVSRRILREHRLWCVTSTVGGDPEFDTVTGTLASQPTVDGFIDLRVLGAMRRGRNVSSF